MNIDIKQVVSLLNLSNLKDFDNYYSCLCPFHNENNNSFIIYKNTGKYICFSCSEEGSLYELVRRLTGKSIYKFLGINYNNYTFINSLNRNNDSDRLKKIQEIKNKNIIVDNDFKSVYTNNQVLVYLYSRYVTDNIIQDFKIQYVDYTLINGTKFYKRIIVPIYYNNKILSYEGRDYTKRQIPKVLYPKNTSVNNCILNIDNLDRNETLYVVEGFMDIVKIYNNISKNVTCIFGAKISDYQIDLLKQFKEFVIIPDNDKAGETTILKLEEYMDKEFYIAKLNKSKDCGDADLKEIEEAIKNKKLSVDYFMDKNDLFSKENIRW